MPSAIRHAAGERPATDTRAAARGRDPPKSTNTSSAIEPNAANSAICWSAPNTTSESANATGTTIAARSASLQRERAPGPLRSCGAIIRLAPARPVTSTAGFPRVNRARLRGRVPMRDQRETAAAGGPGRRPAPFGSVAERVRRRRRARAPQARSHRAHRERSRSPPPRSPTPGSGRARSRTRRAALSTGSPRRWPRASASRRSGVISAVRPPDRRASRRRRPRAVGHHGHRGTRAGT